MRLNTNSLKRTVAVLAAVCTLGTCCIASSIAYAKDDGVNTATIDAKQNGKTSIVIHKYENDPAGTTPGNGEKVNDLGNRKPIQGVKFTLWRVKKKSGTDAGEIDLSNADGWKKIKGLESLEAKAAKDKKTANGFMTGDNAEFEKYDTAGDGAEKANGQTCETGADGSCSFPNLKMGLYYIEETDVSGAQLQENNVWKKVSITKGVDPFFVTTPLANETKKTWLYEVNVYPKNDTSNDLPKKTPHDTPSSLNIKEQNGTTMSWDITIPLNLVASGEKFTTIKFTDPLMKDLVFDSVSNVKISKFKKDSATPLTGNDNSSDLTEANNDYTVSTATQKYTVGTKQEDFTLVTVNLTGGLAKADTLYASRGTNVLKLTATITAKVKQGATKVVNVINTEVNNVVTGQKKDPKPCVPTTEKPCDNPGQSVTNFATLKVTKFNDQTGQDRKTLRDAEFEVYAMKDKNAAPTTNDGVTSSTDNKKVDGVTLKTDKEGKASVELFVGNGDTTSKKYCIVETKAPAGYNLSNTPTCYDLTVESAANAATNNSKEVVNKLSTALDKIVGALPMTGARGLVLLTAFGIVGLGGTLFYIITRRRKEQEEA
ncbi:SpaH/EbpB family LPXTG-anchored major pilin [Gardnerella vaginalis]|uniref:SpaH/EbpB family LPXTG-anchored major pilin n=1 Tax=Gardnerella vaginalis TaxID=2702 RepID=UPI0039EE4B52